MKKRILTSIIAVMVSASLISCSALPGNNKKSENTSTETVDRYAKLKGEWAKDTTKADFDKKYNELLKAMEKQTDDYGLKYDKKSSINDKDKSNTITDSYIVVLQDKPEENKLESFYFGEKVSTGDNMTGQIYLKASLKFDGKTALKKEKFDFGDTSIAKYSEIFTGKKDRDYSSINKKIIDILKSDSKEGVITSNLDGLYEEFTITKDYIAYTLETKELTFKTKTELNS